MLQITLTIKGKVQKVGFRYSVVDFVMSKSLPIVGQVRNKADGSVQVIAQGDIESLKELHRFCAKGPPHSEVREISEDLKKIKRQEFKEFVIIKD
ncbi:MAG TPA: acylphosphatase [Bacteriovoracaceae bacterium]|nr:acylphosphatase [Bacteriovoracaceae bacterium]